jgi:hypothetical protein
MADPLQLVFSDYEQIFAKKRTRRQRFLDEMEITVPWEAFLAGPTESLVNPSPAPGSRSSRASC